MTARLWRLGRRAGAGLALYAGACVGGSTVINDALCFRPPPALLAGLAATTTGSAGSRTRSWRRSSSGCGGHPRRADRPGPHEPQRRPSGAAARARLGWSASPTPRNVQRTALNLGLCNFGCPSGAKQSTLVTYVPRAERAGARVLAGTRAERVRLEADGCVAWTPWGRPPARRTRSGASSRRRSCASRRACSGRPALLQRSGVPGVAGGGRRSVTLEHARDRRASRSRSTATTVRRWRSR